MKILLATILLIAAPTVVLGQTVDLIWETETSAPAGYQGKLLPTTGSAVRVTAFVPQANKDNFYFWWTKDGQNLRELSGRGRDTLNYLASGGSNTVSVAVRDEKNRPLGEASATIPVVKPKVLFYERDPLLGLLNRQVITAKQLTKPETIFVAAPYFFAAGSDNQLAYSWTLEGRPAAPDTGKPDTMTVILPASGAGENLITLTVKNLANSLQEAKNSFTINFNAVNSFYNNENIF